MPKIQTVTHNIETYEIRVLRNSEYEIFMKMTTVRLMFAVPPTGRILTHATGCKHPRLRLFIVFITFSQRVRV
jgi:hypothetical protein